jgi:hypothetical protein
VSSVRRAYEQALRVNTPRVAESTEPENELAWQARWFSGACGRKFTSALGAEVVVTDFGQWNREAGPDFVNASVRIEGKDFHGAIEVDLSPSGWEQHGHATNPAYENVVLHVVVKTSVSRHFSRTRSHREVPQICLADHGGAKPEWSGFAAARPGRCLAPLRELPSDKLCDLLAVAARRRFERKGAELRRMMDSRGIDAALYEAVAVALGYKNNKLPFQLLAQRVPLKFASSAKGEALLFGVAGFLERPEPPSGAAKSELAQLWSAWWKQRASCVQSILPRSSWNLAGIRPANHPLRRIAALSAMAGRWKSVRAALESADINRLTDTLAALEHPFWSYHSSWNSPRRKTPMALLGSDRIREIYANIAIPLAMAGGKEPAWLDIPSGPSNTSLRVVSARLFGGPLPRNLPKRIHVQQGLLQIYADFCLRDHSECADCRFPSMVAGLPA